MGLSVRAGSFNIGTGAVGTTTTVPHGLGTTPKAIILWWSGRTESTNTDGSATHLRGMGFSDGATDHACAGRDADGGGTAQTNCGNINTGCILAIGDTNFEGAAAVQSWDASDIIFEIVDVFVSNLRVSYLVVGGSDITNAEVGSFTAAGTAPVNQEVNLAGAFQPTITFLLGIPSTVMGFMTGADSTLFFGAATDSTHEAVWMGGSNDGVGTGSTGTYCRAGECIADTASASDPSAALGMRAEFVSHDSDGFTINWLERPSAHVVSYLCIKGGRWTIGDFLTAVSVTTVGETGVGFRPDGLLVVSGCHPETAQDATPNEHDEWSVGAQTRASGDITGQAVASRDGNTTMFVMTALRTNTSYANFDPTNDAIEGEAVVQSFDPDGFTWSQTDADPAQAFVWYVAVASDAQRFALHG